MEEIIKLKLYNLKKIKMIKHDWWTHNSIISYYIYKRMLYETWHNKVKYFDTFKKFINALHYSCIKIKYEITEEKLAEAIYHTESLSIKKKNIFKKASECY